MLIFLSFFHERMNFAGSGAEACPTNFIGHKAPNMDLLFFFGTVSLFPHPVLNIVVERFHFQCYNICNIVKKTLPITTNLGGPALC